MILLIGHAPPPSSLVMVIVLVVVEVEVHLIHLAGHAVQLGLDSLVNFPRRVVGWEGGGRGDGGRGARWGDGPRL